MKYIFLDFDGVLNSQKFLRSDYFKQSVVGMTDAELYLTKYQYMLDPTAIKLVNSLVDASGAVVVLSTSHRTKYSLEELNDMLTGRGATFKAVDKIPRLLPKKFSMEVDRGEEIQAFLDSLQEAPESFVILDDFNNMLHLSKYLVRTSDLYGLESEHTELALKILNGDIK